MTATVTRLHGPARKPNRRPGATAQSVAQLADYRRAARFAAAWHRETRPPARRAAARSS